MGLASLTPDYLAVEVRRLAVGVSDLRPLVEAVQSECRSSGPLIQAGLDNPRLAEAWSRAAVLFCPEESAPVDVAAAVGILGAREAAFTGWVTLLVRAFRHRLSSYDWSAELFWERSVLTALLTERFAAMEGAASAPSFLAGLTHALGCSFIDRHCEQWNLVGSLAQAEPDAQARSERALVGIDFAETSGRLLAAWQAPSEVVDGVRWLLHPEFARDGERIALRLQRATQMVFALSASDTAPVSPAAREAVGAVQTRWQAYSGLVAGQLGTSPSWLASTWSSRTAGGGGAAAWLKPLKRWFDRDRPASRAA